MKHEGIFPFSCGECEKAYTSKGELEVHLKTHQGKLYQCHICPKAYSGRNVNKLAVYSNLTCNSFGHGSSQNLCQKIIPNP